MTIEQILNGANAVSPNELQNRFLIKSIKSGIQNRADSMVSSFMDNIERCVMHIADNSIMTSYPTCMDDKPSQIVLDDAAKTELIKKVGEIAKKQVEDYKKTISYVFSEDTKSEQKTQEAPKIEITTDEEKPAVAVVKDMFGY